jgi:hypothetical protein
MIKNKFSGYSRDGIRRLFDPATVAAFTAGMSSAGTAAAVAAPTLTAAGLGTGTMAGTMLGTTGATLGSTAGLGAAGTAAGAGLGAGAAGTAAGTAAGATSLGAAAPEIAANLAAAGEAGAPMAQGIMQGGTQVAASGAPGAVGAAPAAPAGSDTAAMMTNQIGPMVNAPATPPTGTPSAIPAQADAFGSPYGLNNFTDKEIASRVAERYANQGGGGLMDGLTKGFNTAMDFAKDHPFYTTAGLYAAQKSGIFGGGMEEDKDKYGGRVDMSAFRGMEPNPTFRAAEGGPVEAMSNMNAMSGNPYYPMSQQPRLAYANPGVQNPISQNVLDVGGTGRLDPYTGMPTFAKGGKTETFYEKVMREDEERMAQARRAMRDYTPDISGPGIVSRTLTQQQRRPDEAARSSLAGIAKQAGVKLSDMPKANVPEDFAYEAAKGGIMRGDLGDYSDGGRLLKGPGDGVSDSIPASIGRRQPARLADGEFVIPARIVSELGNGSTEAGARQLYAMMERVQKRRGKTVGKGKVAVDSKAKKDLPA